MPTASEQLEGLAALLGERAHIDSRIAALITRPALPGHIGEFIAARIFGIILHDSAATPGSDGTFAEGPLAGASVNIKLYGKSEGMLDLPREDATAADYTLVLVGPRAAATTSRGGTRPVAISSAYLFHTETLLEALRLRRVKIGVATSVARSFWNAAEMYPNTGTGPLRLNERQRELLALFAPERQLDS